MALATPDIVRQAHKIRKAIAAREAVPARYIHWGDCLKAAEGRRAESKIRNTFGSVIGTTADQLHRYLLLDADCPIAVFIDDMLDNVGMTKSYLTRHLQKLQTRGKIQYCRGTWQIIPDARPCPQPMPAD